MSTGTKVKTFWKVHVISPPTEAVYFIALSLCAIAYFKCVPYFADRSVVKAFVRESTKRQDSSEGAKLPENLSTSDSSTSGSSSLKARLAEFGRTSASRTGTPRVLERPLFDGKNVTLQVKVSGALDSNSGDTVIEGQILSVLDPEQIGAVDSGIVLNGLIRGTATPNFDAKRYMAQFSEIVTPDGKAIPVSAVAFNPADSTTGIPSEYKSGLTSRLAGSAIKRVIVAADAVAESRLLDDGSTTAVDRELSRVAQQGSSDTANGLSDEASKTLRETKPVLRVPAGSIIYVKMQVGRSVGGLR